VINFVKTVAMINFVFELKNSCLHCVKWLSLNFTNLLWTWKFCNVFLSCLTRSDGFFVLSCPKVNYVKYFNLCILILIEPYRFCDASTLNDQHIVEFLVTPVACPVFNIHNLTMRHSSIMYPVLSFRCFSPCFYTDTKYTRVCENWLFYCLGCCMFGSHIIFLLLNSLSSIPHSPLAAFLFHLLQQLEKLPTYQIGVRIRY